MARGLLSAMASAVGQRARVSQAFGRITMEKDQQDVPEVGPSGSQSIRDLRTRLGMTQEEFAHSIAVTVSTVNRWENGHAHPSKLAWRAIQALARKRGTTLAAPRGRQQA